MINLPAPNAATVYTKPRIFSSQLDQINATVAYNRGYFGQGVTVAIIDSGLRTTHEAFRDKVVDGVHIENTMLLTNAVTDGYGHGTRVAGLVAGEFTDFQSGVAPQAKILPIQIANASGVFNGRVTIALQYAVSQTVQIINYSLTTPIGGRHRFIVGYEGANHSWVPQMNYEVMNPSRTGYPVSYIDSGRIFGETDLVFVAASGNGYFNGETGQVTLVNTNTSITSTVAMSSFISKATVYSFMLNDLPPLPFNILASEYFSEGGNGPTGREQIAPHYDVSLRSQILVVGSVGDNYQIRSASNGCGASKNWCLVAPGNYRIAENTSHTGDTDVVLRTLSGTSFATARVSGALAVLKSRLSSMPMTIVRVLLLKTATNLGELGVDNVYGHGLVNLGKAITIQGHVAINVSTDSSSTSSTSQLLVGSTIALSPALRGFGQGVSGISIATELFDNFYYDTALISVMGIDPTHDYGISLGFAANDLLSTSKQEIGGIGVQTNRQGNLANFGFKRKQGLLNYSLCAKCKNSVWDEYTLDYQALPFFADTQRKLQGGWSLGDSIDTFVALGLDEDNEKDKYAQYGINWKGVELGEWELAGGFSRIQEQEGYLLGSKFEGAFGIGKSSSTQLGLRAQRYVEGWRLFGGVDYGKTQTDTINNSLIRRIQGLNYAGWRLGLDKDSIFRNKDKIHFGLTKVPSVISGSMDLELSQTTGETAYDDNLAMDYLNKAEFRKHKINLDDSDAFVYRLGYSTSIHKRQRLALGFEHYTDKVNQDNTAFSVQYKVEL